MPKEKITLFTNLKFALVNGIRVSVSAVILEDYEDGLFGNPTRRIRGFGPDPAWPVFDAHVPSMEHTLTGARSNADFLKESGDLVPLSTGLIMQFKDGARIDLYAENDRHPIDIDKFEGDKEDRIILKVWDALSEKTKRYWDAPNMPFLHWGAAPHYKRRS